MDETQLEKLTRACVIIGQNVASAVEGIKAAMAALQANELAFSCGCESADDMRDRLNALLRDFSEAEATGYLSTYADEAEPIPPPKKTPRPPKRTGPINKANYTANRPPRMARSSCNNFKR